MKRCTLNRVKQIDIYSVAIVMLVLLKRRLPRGTSANNVLRVVSIVDLYIGSAYIMQTCD